MNHPGGETNVVAAVINSLSHISDIYHTAEVPQLLKGGEKAKEIERRMRK